MGIWACAGLSRFDRNFRRAFARASDFALRLDTTTQGPHWRNNNLRQTGKNDKTRDGSAEAAL
jgi:hypothetical protein